MKQWDIWLFAFERERPHPVVILSSDERAAGPALYVNALICRTLRGDASPKSNEILLDRADGLDWATVCQSDFLYALEKKKFLEKRGQVTYRRQLEICRKMIFCLRLRWD